MSTNLLALGRFKFAVYLCVLLYLLMLKIENAVLSFDIIEEAFICDLNKCKGACCIHGDSGAPLDLEETLILEEIYPLVKPYLRVEGAAAIEQQGYFVTDSDNDFVTPLINGAECAYVIFDEGVAKCAIEKAWADGLFDFQKPISCHLYPIRITRYETFDALNYHEWDICKAACVLGKREKVPIYVFLEQPLTRKYGVDWYKQLKLAASEYIKYKKQNSVN